MRLAGIAVAFVLVPVVVWAQSGPNPYLGQAKLFYQGLEYENCLQHLEQASRWENTPQELVEIEIYSALSKFNLDQAKDAEAHLQRALQLDPRVALPPFSSPKIESLLDAVRAAMPKSADTATADAAIGPKKDGPVRADLEPKPKEVSPLDTELRAEPGKGRYGLPIAIGGLAVAAAGIGGLMGLQAKRLEGEANAASFESDAIALGNQASQRALLANIGFGAAAAAATAAVVTLLLNRD